MSPSDLAKVAAKYGVSKDVARLSLGTGGSVTQTNTEQTEVPACSPKRIRQSSKPLMNKLEQEFYEKLTTGDVHYVGILIQAVRFRLGNGIWYKPDFMMLAPIPRVTAWEVKGPHSFRGGFENLKVAASLYPEIRWILVWKQDGQWQEQQVLP